MLSVHLRALTEMSHHGTEHFEDCALILKKVMLIFTVFHCIIYLYFLELKKNLPLNL